MTKQEWLHILAVFKIYGHQPIAEKLDEAIQQECAKEYNDKYKIEDQNGNINDIRKT